MPDSPHKPAVPSDKNAPRSRWVDVLLILIIGVFLVQLYSPLLLWLGKTTISTAQLNTGGLLVLFAMAICLRDTIGKIRIEPNLNSHGLGLLFLAFACLWLAARLPRAMLPLVLLSFCLALASIIAFLYGKLGVREFLPALGGFLVFGLLVGLFPALDWPLREIAGKYSAATLNWMEIPVKLVPVPSRPPEILLAVKDKIYVVATECNGFGLLTSSLLLATILGFQYRLNWVRKLALFSFAIPIALVFNFLRIVNICLVVPRTKISYSVVHEGVGTMFYMIGLAVIWYAAGEFVDRKDSRIEDGGSKMDRKETRTEDIGSRMDKPA